MQFLTTGAGFQDYSFIDFLPVSSKTYANYEANPKRIFSAGDLRLIKKPNSMYEIKYGVIGFLFGSRLFTGNHKEILEKLADGLNQVPTQNSSMLFLSLQELLGQATEYSGNYPSDLSYTLSLPSKVDPIKGTCDINELGIGHVEFDKKNFLYLIFGSSALTSLTDLRKLNEIIKTGVDDTSELGATPTSFRNSICTAIGDLVMTRRYKII